MPVSCKPTTKPHLRDAVDIARGLAAAAREAGWRLCRHCGELAIPPARSALRDCITCTKIVPTDKTPIPDGATCPTS